MSNEICLLPIKPGVLDSYDKQELKKVGIIVLEVENPEEIKLIRPTIELSANQLTRSAIEALMELCDGSLTHSRFVRSLGKAILGNLP